jgi:DNA-binding XRE family transcriptional regulator
MPTKTYLTRLAEILDTEGRSQAWLGRVIGTSRTTIHSYCKGLHVPDDKKALIAEALGREISDVFPGTERLF